jgi:hypothetical protein
MNGNNLISLVRWPQRFLVTDRHWGDLWEGKRKATPLAPGAKQQRFKSRIKANTDPVDGRANVYGQGHFLPRLHPHQAWVLSYVNRKRFGPNAKIQMAT